MCSDPDPFLDSMKEVIMPVSIPTKPVSVPSPGQKNPGITIPTLKPTDIVSLNLDVTTAKTLLHALSIAIGGSTNPKNGKGGKGGK
jgi:hypothetical protein